MATLERAQEPRTPEEEKEMMRDFWESPLGQHVYDPVMVAYELGHLTSNLFEIKS